MDDRIDGCTTGVRMSGWVGADGSWHQDELPIGPYNLYNCWLCGNDYASFEDRGICRLCKDTGAGGKCSDTHNMMRILAARVKRLEQAEANRLKEFPEWR